jgi:hypothetical protein
MIYHIQYSYQYFYMYQVLALPVCQYRHCVVGYETIAEVPGESTRLMLVGSDVHFLVLLKKVCTYIRGVHCQYKSHHGSSQGKRRAEFRIPCLVVFLACQAAR